ncbi:MAG: glycosyl transferase family protein [Rhodospirillales bacterium]|jgi:anthranilate phosphoribosyltransferase|nr:glycosyl transferase [Rhodospirillaceae bacterium]MDP6428161.1 glycosyl transferase family protein [Rhodospirillales bacterium]MDP6642956.1 glycosyl transferase family protein [Rhodospirillales bacterium]
MSEEHPFAPYVRILARGKTKSRPFTGEEAEAAMAMILAGQVRPEQLGAFLMLLRFKEETAEEIAGFVRAARATFDLPGALPGVDLDWSSYAGKRRQLPWFLLSALVLAQNGVRVIMHGTEGHTPGRVYLRDTLETLGLPVSNSFTEAAAAVEAAGFAYLPLEVLSPVLREIINLRPVLGLRSPVHTVSRLLNPFSATHVLQGIFHRGFQDTHQVAAQILGYSEVAVFRGEGGEIERRPNKPAEVFTLSGGALGEENWPTLIDDPVQPEDADMDISRLARIWRGEEDDEYGAAAVAGTLAIALKLLGRAGSIDQADSDARAMWQGRDRTKMGLAA